MERRQVEYFVAVADHGGFGRAAAEMHVTQSALSQAIAQLEREFRTQLFMRTPRGVVLTPAGKAALGPARQSLRSLTAIQSAVSHVIGLSGGTLDIASLPSLAQWPVSPIVAKFRQAYPQVKVTIKGPEARRVPEVAEMVRDGTCEVGFTEAHADTAGLVHHPLAKQDFVAVMPAGTPLAKPGEATWDEVTECGLIVGPWWETSTPFAFLDERYGRELANRIAIRIDHREAYLPLIVSGAGAAILPRISGELAAASGAVVADVVPTISRSVVLIYPEGELPPAARAFCKLVETSVSPSASSTSRQLPVEHSGDLSQA